jgi:hypothetical protein
MRAVFSHGLYDIRHARTACAAGALAPVAFRLDGFVGAQRVQNEGAVEQIRRKKNFRLDML